MNLGYAIYYVTPKGLFQKTRVVGDPQSLTDGRLLAITTLEDEVAFLILQKDGSSATDTFYAPSSDVNSLSRKVVTISADRNKHTIELFYTSNGVYSREVTTTNPKQIVLTTTKNGLTTTITKSDSRKVVDGPDPSNPSIRRVETTGADYFVVELYHRDGAYSRETRWTSGKHEWVYVIDERTTTDTIEPNKIRTIDGYAADNQSVRQVTKTGEDFRSIELTHPNGDYSRETFWTSGRHQIFMRVGGKDYTDEYYPDGSRTLNDWAPDAPQVKREQKWGSDYHSVQLNHPNGDYSRETFWASGRHQIFMRVGGKDHTDEFYPDGSRTLSDWAPDAPQVKREQKWGSDYYSVQLDHPNGSWSRETIWTSGGREVIINGDRTYTPPAEADADENKKWWENAGKDLSDKWKSGVSMVTDTYEKIGSSLREIRAKAVEIADHWGSVVSKEYHEIKDKVETMSRHWGGVLAKEFHEAKDKVEGISRHWGGVVAKEYHEAANNVEEATKTAVDQVKQNVDTLVSDTGPA